MTTGTRSAVSLMSNSSGSPCRAASPNAGNVFSGKTGLPRMYGPPRWANTSGAACTGAAARASAAAATTPLRLRTSIGPPTLPGNLRPDATPRLPRHPDRDQPRSARPDGPRGRGPRAGPLRRDRRQGRHRRGLHPHRRLPTARPDPEPDPVATGQAEGRPQARREGTQGPRRVARRLVAPPKGRLPSAAVHVHAHDAPAGERPDLHQVAEL